MHAEASGTLETQVFTAASQQSRYESGGASLMIPAEQAPSWPKWRSGMDTQNVIVRHTKTRHV